MFSSCRAARGRKTEDRVASSVVRKISIGENYEGRTRLTRSDISKFSGGTSYCVLVVDGRGGLTRWLQDKLHTHLVSPSIPGSVLPDVNISSPFPSQVQLDIWPHFLLASS